MLKGVTERSVPIEKITVIRSRERSEDGFEELVESLKKYPQLKGVHLIPTKDGKYDLFSGEGRFEAAKRLGRKEIRAYVFDPKKTNKKEILINWLASNIQREEPLHRALKMYEDKQKGLTTKQIAKKYGAKESGVRQSISTIKRTNEKLLEKVAGGEIDYSKVQAISGHFSDHETQHQVAEQVIEAHATHKQTLAIIRGVRRAKQQTLPIPELRSTISSMEKELKQLTGSNRDWQEKLSLYIDYTRRIVDDVEILGAIRRSNIRIPDFITKGE